MRKLAALALLVLVPASVAAQDAPMGQIILENSSTLDADLYVDGDYACHAPSHSDCVAEVTSGVHVPMIVFANDDYIMSDYIMSDPVDVPAYMSMTLPVRDLTT